MDHAFAGTLHLAVRVSVVRCVYLVVSHLLALLVIVGLAWHRPVLASLLLPVGVSGAIAWQNAQLRTKRSIQTLRWSATGRWTWQTCDKRWREGELIAAYVASTWLVILTLRENSHRWQRVYCPLFGDALDRRTHRHLRARLTVAPPSAAAAADD